MLGRQSSPLRYVILNTRFEMGFPLTYLQMFQGRDIPWEYQVSMLSDFERVANLRQGGEQATAAAFHVALCSLSHGERGPVGMPGIICPPKVAVDGSLPGRLKSASIKYGLMRTKSHKR